MDLEALYHQITAITEPMCARCVPPYHCCAPVGCGQAQCWARGEYGIELPVTSDNPLSTLPYLTKKGCTVAPHHRPLCSLWLCPEAEKLASDEYWDLKEQITKLEVERFKKGRNETKEVYA